MNSTSEILERINKSSSNHHDGVFTRLYRYLLREDIYLAAYQKLDNDNSFSKECVSELITELQNGTYKPKPVRREYIQKANGKLCTLGIPSFKDKLLQEAVRSILEAIYEPIFLDQSHGFRPNRSCRTALEQLKNNFRSVKWFIGGGIKGCLDNIDHKILISTLEVKIKDSKFVNIIRSFLKAGYIEDFHYNSTLSGTPKGGIISPILANIYLHELDKKVAEIKERFDAPASSRLTSEYRRLAKRRQTLQKKIDRVQGEEREAAKAEYKAICKEKFRTPCKQCDDKKLVYCRYADDFLIGISGSREECEAIREELRLFLENNYKLGIENTKHSSERVRFLGYDVSVRRNQEVKKRKDGRKQRTLNNSVELTVPLDRIMQYLFNNEVIQKRPDGKIWPVAIPRLTHMSDVDIVNRYNKQVRDICNYYCLAANFHKLNYFRYLMEYSCLKTIACKHDSTTRKIMKKYHLKDGWGVPYETEKGIKYATIVSLAKCKVGKMMVDHDPSTFKTDDVKKLSQIKRLENGVCELCGQENKSCKVFHAGKMKNLRGNTEWGKKMLRMKRKTLIVCPECYRKIHEERYVNNKWKAGYIERCTSGLGGVLDKPVIER